MSTAYYLDLRQATYDTQTGTIYPEFQVEAHRYTIIESETEPNKWTEADNVIVRDVGIEFKDLPTIPGEIYGLKFKHRDHTYKLCSGLKFMCLKVLN